MRDALNRRRQCGQIPRLSGGMRLSVPRIMPGAFPGQAPWQRLQTAVYKDIMSL